MQTLQTRKKNILLITHFLPPSYTAGTEQYTLALGKALQDRGFKVTILCAEDWDSGSKYWNGVTSDTLDGVLIHRIHLNWLKARRPNQILYDSTAVERWLDGFLSNQKFDVVHVTSTYSLGVGILRSVKRANIPLVLTLMDFWFICPSLQLLRSDGVLCDGNTTPLQCVSCLMANSRIYRRLTNSHLPRTVTDRFLDTLSRMDFVSRQRGFRGMLLNMRHRKEVMKETFTLPDVVISPSKIVKSIFAKNMKRPVEYLPYRHDLSWLKDYHETTRSDILNVGYLGQIQYVKGVHVLIAAFMKAGIESKARLHIWGNYSNNQQYERVLREQIGNNISITLRGKYSREQLGSILSELDVVVIPSLWYENAPLVIQEAFATKTPVIAANLGGMSEAVNHDVNGLLFERNNSDDLARQLCRVVDEENLLEKLKGGILPVKGFQNDLLEIETVYDRIIIEKSGSS
jgi:glycosyltransferase involved in cell wall biosynthesis